MEPAALGRNCPSFRYKPPENVLFAVSSLITPYPVLITETAPPPALLVICDAIVKASGGPTEGVGARLVRVRKINSAAPLVPAVIVPPVIKCCAAASPVRKIPPPFVKVSAPCKVIVRTVPPWSLNRIVFIDVAAGTVRFPPPVKSMLDVALVPLTVAPPAKVCENAVNGTTLPAPSFAAQLDVAGFDPAVAQPPMIPLGP